MVWGHLSAGRLWCRQAQLRPAGSVGRGITVPITRLYKYTICLIHSETIVRQPIFLLSDSLTLAPTHPVTHTHTHPRSKCTKFALRMSLECLTASGGTRSLTPSTQSPTHPLTPSPTPSLLAHSLTHSITLSLFHSLTHSLTHSLPTHSLACQNKSRSPNRPCVHEHFTQNQDVQTAKSESL